MYQLNYLHLYHFFMIAKEGQLARAAKRLRLGQPTLSTQLKQLEENLGYRLFDRKRGETLRLTEKGKTIFAYAQEIFRLGDEMMATAQGSKTAVRAVRLRIGALDSLPKRIVYQIMELACPANDCTVTLLEDTSTQLVSGLAAHRFDVIVSNSPAPHRLGKLTVQTKQLAKMPVIVCGARPFRPLKKGFPASLSSQFFMVPTPDGKLRGDVDAYFRAHDVDVGIVGEVQDAELLRLVALSGRALVPISRLTVEDDLRRGDLLEIGELTGVFEEIWISVSSRLVDHPIASRLIRTGQLLMRQPPPARNPPNVS